MPRNIAVLLAIVAAVVATSATTASADPTLPSNDPFYAPPAGIAARAPGTVLRSRTVTVVDSGNQTVSATQILYRTNGQLGQPTATVATVIRPTAPPALTRIVSYQTAYDGLGGECDPSYTLQGGNSSYTTAQDEEQIILSYAAQGYTVVVPDYEGERLDWAAGQESGENTLDGIRAAENLVGVAPGSTPVGMVGYSGGSIATEFASELAPTYSPELNIAGTAEGGVPVDFLHNLSYINGSPSWSGVIPAVLVSLSRAFAIDFGQYLNPFGLRLTQSVSNECINNFIGSYPGLTIQKLLRPQYRQYLKIPDLVRIADHLIMGRTGLPKGPLLIAVGNQDGTGDGVMVAKDVQQLAYQYCRRGLSVQFTTYNGDDHTTAAIPFEGTAQQFLDGVLAGGPAQNGCGSITPGNSLTPQPIPPPLPSISVLYARAAPRLHAFIVALRGSSGTLRSVVVTMKGGRVMLRARVARLGRRKVVVALRRGRRMPAAGTYTLTVSAGGNVYVKRTVTLG